MAFQDHIEVMDKPKETTEYFKLGEIFSLSLQFCVGAIGFLGNILVCIVFGFLRSRKSQVNMFLFNQALVDLCTSILLIVYGATYIHDARTDFQSTVNPPSEEMKYTDAGGQFLCRFWWSRFFLFSTFAISSYNLLVMSIERYIAVKRPLNYSNFFNTRTCMFVIFTVWIFPPIMQYIPAIFQYTYANNSCTERESWDRSDQVIFGICLFCWEYLLPVSIMGYMYFVIANTLRKRKSEVGVSLSRANASVCSTQASPGNRMASANQSTNMPPRGTKSSRNTTSTLFILFAVFVICWTPNQVTFLAYNVGGDVKVSSKWYQATVILAFLNSCINPCIYCMRLKKFQMGLKLLLTCKARNETILSLESTVSR
ncbi:beta-2 adrenergic receptor-like [Apostichopus japonicus]|uniref:beta-2 adrenergic receptor-like n=1 Tax=Stichopus japonicus TaxID=307972 RepID=UPI003AB29A40